MHEVFINENILNRIQGYLDGIANIASFYGGCYTHTYEFTEYIYKSDVYECINAFWENSLVRRHNAKIIGLLEVEDWQNELFSSCSDWFFSLFRNQNFEVRLEDECGNIVPAEKDMESNYVFYGFIKLLTDFFEGVEVKVYKLQTEPNYQDEFEWEQFLFDCKGKGYLLHFYQQG